LFFDKTQVLQKNHKYQTIGVHVLSTKKTSELNNSHTKEGVFMSRITAFISVFLLILVLSACLPDKGKNIPDVSNIEVEVNIKRFDKDLFKIDTLNLSASKAALAREYDPFMDEIYMKRILPALQDSMVLSAFLSSTTIQKLQDTCYQVFGELTEEKASLEEAFRFYKHYFPDAEIPEVITFISEYTLGVFTYEGMVGIGLDFFLGKDHELYRGLFPDYINQTMNKDHIVAKAVEAVTNDMVGEPQGEKLLDIMVNNGKILYIMDRLLPHEPDSVKLGYTAAQTQWCNDNELQMWAHFLDEELLYKTQLRDIRKLVEPSPHSPGMPPEAPGRTANWVGWQIVKSYMKRFPDTTLQQLIDLKDAQKIMAKGKYKPS